METPRPEKVVFMCFYEDILTSIMILLDCTKTNKLGQLGYVAKTLFSGKVCLLEFQKICGSRWEI